MAIKLYVEEYCADCGEFKPEVEKTTITGYHETRHNTCVRCKNSIRCQRIANHIQKEMGKKNHRK